MKACQDPLVVAPTPGPQPSPSVFATSGFTRLASPFSPSNQSKVADAQLGALAVKQVGQLNLQERLQTYRQMEPIIAEEQYYIMFNTTTQSWAWDPSLRNIRIPKEQANHATSAMKWWFG